MNVTVTRETIDRVLFQLGSFASLLETYPEMSSTKASHIDALASTLRDEVHALGICRRYLPTDVTPPEVLTVCRW